MPETPARDDEEDTPLLEWIFGAIGLVLFAGALVVTVLNGLSQDEPPTITTRIEQAQPSAGRFRVEFEATNSGDETAAHVQLVATLKDGGAVVESRTVEIDFLPPHSSRRAGVLFDRSPEGLVVEIKAVSYQHP